MRRVKRLFSSIKQDLILTSQIRLLEESEKKIEGLATHYVGLAKPICKGRTIYLYSK